MNSLATPNFPIEARFTVTQDALQASDAALKSAGIPGWVPIALLVAFALQTMIQLPKILMGGNGSTIFIIFALVVGFFGIVFWRGYRKKERARAAILGAKIVVRFQNDGFELGEAPTCQRIPYSRIVRIGRDARGLVLIVTNAGGLFIPTWAFASPEQRDIVFGHLGEALKKK